MAEAKSAKKTKKEPPLTETGDVQRVTDFLIKPESSIPKLDTSKWPLLLKVRADNIDMRVAVMQCFLAVLHNFAPAMLRLPTASPHPTLPA